MDLVRKQARKQVLCSVTQAACLMTRMYRSNLQKSDVIVICDMVSRLCTAFCKESANHCKEAVKALKNGDEAEYLEICKKASQSCGLNKQNPKEDKPNKYTA